MARHVIHGISVAKVPDRWRHVIKQYGCYNKYVTRIDGDMS